MELLRLRFDEQVRSEKRRSASTALEGQPVGTLKPWREVVTPHRDVAKGSYQQAEFAAYLWQVYLGEGGDEYRDPVEFFRRTFLTESLKGLLTGALQRLGENAGDPVVQLQTNFGGGKTHLMLALYHLFSGRAAADLPGLEAVLGAPASSRQGDDAGRMPALPVKRVVIVGNKISPGNPRTKMARWCGRSGANWRGNSAGRKAMRSSLPTTKKRPAPATRCACFSTSVGRASS